MSSRRRPESSPIQGGIVCRESPSLYWLIFEQALPRTCAACPYGRLQEGGTRATCTIAGTPLQNIPPEKPPCSRGDWQRRARSEVAVLFERLIPSDEELAEIAAELSRWPQDRDAPPEAAG